MIKTYYPGTLVTPDAGPFSVATLGTGGILVGLSADYSGGTLISPLPTGPQLPDWFASFGAFENAMTLDIAMGGSTNTVLHILAAAHEAEIDFTMKDIDRLSRRVPVLSKVAKISCLLRISTQSPTCARITISKYRCNG